jgi:hypothetical protein
MTSSSLYHFFFFYFFLSALARASSSASFSWFFLNATSCANRFNSSFVKSRNSVCSCNSFAFLTRPLIYETFCSTAESSNAQSGVGNAGSFFFRFFFFSSFLGAAFFFFGSSSSTSGYSRSGYACSMWRTSRACKLPCIFDERAAAFCK